MKQEGISFIPTQKTSISHACTHEVVSMSRKFKKALTDKSKQNLIGLKTAVLWIEVVRLMHQMFVISCQIKYTCSDTTD